MISNSQVAVLANGDIGGIQSHPLVQQIMALMVIRAHGAEGFRSGDLIRCKLLTHRRLDARMELRKFALKLGS